MDDTERDTRLGGDGADGGAVDPVTARDDQRRLDELLASLGDR